MQLVTKLELFIFSIIIVLSIIIPTDFSLLKIILLGLLLSLIPFSHSHYSKTILLWTLGFATIGLIWSLYGGAIGNPGAFRVMTVMIAYPLIFFVISSAFNKINDFKHIHTVLIIASFLVVVVEISFLLSAYGLLPSSIANSFIQRHPGNAVLDIGSNYLLFTLPNVSSLLFLIPYVSTYILLNKELKYKYIFLLLVMIMLIILTGRRAFFVSYGISIFSLILVSMYLKPYIKVNLIGRILKITFIVTLLFGAIIIYYQIGLSLYAEKITSIFDFSANESNIERRNQFFSLLDGISSSPFLGNGAGAAASYSRSVEQPWAYELSYMALIFQYGIFGFLVYFFGTLYLIWRMIHILKDTSIDLELKKFIISFLIGMISFLISNATNPYLGKFDYMWVIFIPVMLVNTYNVNKRKIYHAKKI